jgi:hypothetical protein
MQHIGLDFDNTIVDYRNVYKSLAKKFDVPASGVINKNIIKKFIITEFGEPQWTKLQGEIYGPLIDLATLSVGFEKFITNTINKESAKISIISHRTQTPDSGDNYNLHEFAQDWLKKNLSQSILSKVNIYFLETIEKKIDQINTSKVDYFVDDLEKILTHPNLSKDIKKIFYTPDKNEASLNGKIVTIHNWLDLENILNKEEI